MGSIELASPESATVAPQARSFRPWLLPAVALIVGYWGLQLTLNLVELPISTKFFSMALAAAVLPLLFTIWWFSNRRVAWRDRWMLFAAMVGLGVVAGLLVDTSIGIPGLFLVGLAIVLTGWTLWLVCAARASSNVQRYGLLLVLAVCWGVFLLARINGITGDQMATLHWRWTPTAESVYVAERRSEKQLSPAIAPSPVTVSHGDWSEFRGPKRDGVLHGVEIASDWTANPPKLLWKQRVGPAWSSFAVIGDRLYTQEQRGEQEAVVCLDAATGKQIWMHADKARFWDGQAGAGPRATPTFADGRIYTLGGTGILNCCDAASGKLIWTHDTVQEAGATVQMWGISNSPLVVDGLVIVWAGGPDNKGLLAYRCDDGQLAWTAAAGINSYSSPQLVEIDGTKQLVFLSELGLLSVEPATGALLWNFQAENPQIWRVNQPQQIGASRLLIGCEDLGLVTIDVARNGDKWTATEHSSTNAMRPGYNDIVVSDVCVFGLMGGVGCCVDLASGKRLWKGGRHGHGQVLLLADQKILLVLGETGDVALVRARPERHEELARIPGITGKTWNHPVIAHGKLFIRNDELMACFELRMEPEEIVLRNASP
jgi:outer membrane protein assembly factor BamB